MRIEPRKRKLTQEQRAEKIRNDKIAKGELPNAEQEIDGLKSISSALIGGEQADDVTAAKQINRALQMFCNTLPEEEAMTVAAVFPEWDLGLTYKPNTYVRYGLNADGEPQIYRVLQDHVSQYAWSPEKAVSLFKAVGFTEDGAALWVQPVGAVDAYQIGDEVVHNGVTYVCATANNVWEPGVYGWTVKP